MAYCTQSDIEKQLAPATVIQLTDDAGAGTVDADNLGEAIEKADTLIDGFLGGLGESLPLSPVPALINKLSVDLSIYYLHERRNDDMTKSAQARYDNSIALLGKIQSGKVRLGLTEGTEVGPGEYRTDKTADDRVFPKTVLDKF